MYPHLIPYSDFHSCLVQLEKQLLRALRTCRLKINLTQVLCNNKSSLMWETRWFLFSQWRSSFSLMLITWSWELWYGLNKEGRRRRKVRRDFVLLMSGAELLLRVWRKIKWICNCWEALFSSSSSLLLLKTNSKVPSRIWRILLLSFVMSGMFADRLWFFLHWTTTRTQPVWRDCMCMVPVVSKITVLIGVSFPFVVGPYYILVFLESVQTVLESVTWLCLWRSLVRVSLCDLRNDICSGFWILLAYCILLVHSHKRFQRGSNPWPYGY